MGLNFLKVLVTMLPLGIYAQTFNWAYNINSNGNSVAYDVVADSLGNTYTVGTFTGTASFGSTSFTSLGSNDVFVCKRSAAGSVVWAVRGGGSSQDDARGVALDTGGNVIVVGQFGGTATFGSNTFTSNGGNDIFVMKIDPNGAIAWSVRYGGTGTEYANDVSVAQNNFVYVVGDFTGTAIFGSNNFPSNGGSDVYLMRITSDLGNLISVSRYGGTSSEYGTSVALDGSGRASFTGYFSGSLTFGSTTITSNGGTDAFLAKTNGSTTANNALNYGGTGNDQGLGLGVDADENVYLSGSYNSSITFGNTILSSAGATDAFITKFDLPGNVIWAKSMGGSTFDEASSVTIAPNGDIVCSGYFSNTASWGSIQKSSSGDRDIFVTKLTKWGNFSWVATAGGSYLDNCHGVATYPTAVYIAGEFKSAGTFGSFNLATSTGTNTDTEPFTAALDLCPTGYNNLNVSSCGSYTLNNQTYGAGGTYQQLLTTVSGCDSVIDINLTVNNTGDANFLWAKPVSGNGSLTQAVTTDAGGNVISTGWFEGASDFNPGTGTFTMSSVGTSDVFVTKLSASGTFAWAKQIGNTGINKGESVIADTAGNIYVFGTFFGTVDFDPGAGTSNLTSSGDADLFVLKLNSSGNFVWAKQFGSDGLDAAGNIVLDVAGNILICGGFQGTGDFDPGVGVTTLTSAGNYDMFVAKLNTAGNLVWVRQAGDINSDYLYHIEPDGLGNIYGTGQFSNTVDFDPGAGTSTLTSVGGLDVVIWKLNAGGNLEWVKQVGSSLGDYGSSLTTQIPGYVYITGHYEALTDFDPGVGTYNITATTAIGDFFVLKLDTAGNFVWATKIGNTGEEYCNDIAVAANGDLILTGTFSGTVDFNPSLAINNLTSAGSKDIFLLRMDAGGNYKWAHGFGATIMDDSYDLHIDHADNMYLAGAFGLTVDFDPGAGVATLTAVVSSDAYTAKFGSCCLPSTATTTVSACNSYTSPSGNYTWTASGTYTDTVSNTTGCDSILTIHLTIKQASFATSSQSICQGQAYFFNGVNRTATGIYLDTLVNTVGCDSIITLNLTVNTNPTASISPVTVTVCNGSNATLTATGGSGYSWSNSLGNSAQVTVSPAATTTYMVTVTNANNCSATVSKTVTVNPLPTVSITPASVAICSGNSSTLTAMGGTIYNWSNSLGNNAQVTVSPAGTTTYIVTVTDANMCSATASRIVTVNQLPLAAINGPTSLCSGLSATLTASGGNNYNWSNGLGTNAQVTVTPGVTSTYTVTVTNANNCSATAQQTISVTTTPAASISGPAQTCAGQPVTLIANGGNTYTWAAGLGSSASITVTPVNTTTYTVTATIGVNCSAMATRTVTVYQTASSQFNQTVCSGNSYSFNGQQLFQSGSYKDTLQTTNGCDSIVTLNLTVTPAGTANIAATICAGNSYTFNGQQLMQAGIYSDTIQNSNGCDSILTLNLTVNSIMSTAIHDTICDGDVYVFNGQNILQSGVYSDTLLSSGNCDSIVVLTVTVNALPQPTITRTADTLYTQTFTDYTWLLNGTPVSGSGNQLALNQNGNYSVVAVDANGCSDTSAIFNVTALSADLLPGGTKSIALYPNPNTGFFTVEFTSETESSLTVTNAIGQVITSLTTASQRCNFNLNDATSGIYFLHVEVAGYKKVLRFNIVK